MAVDRNDHDERQARIEQMMREHKAQRPVRPAKAALARRQPLTSAQSRKRQRRK